MLTLSSPAAFARSTLLLIAAAAGAGAADTEPLAASHPGDRGIDRHPDVFFADDFESGDLKKWDDVAGTAVVGDDAPHAGKRCVAMSMTRGLNHGGDAKKWFLPGAETVYARCYVKFSPEYRYSHHFIWLSANLRSNKWSSFGKAGLKPDGTYFSSGMEPWFAWGKNPPPGELSFYSYFLDMLPDPKMAKYWGNSFFPPGPERGKAAGSQRVIPLRDKWQCWEFMLSANTPGESDGRQAMWLDGKLVGEFTGIRWRNDGALMVNCFWLEHYGMDQGDPTKQYWPEQQTVWFDDVVVARRYIGPMRDGR